MFWIGVGLIALRLIQLAFMGLKVCSARRMPRILAFPRLDLLLLLFALPAIANVAGSASMHASQLPACLPGLLACCCCPRMVTVPEA
jgi:hypothetical protein